MLVASATKKGFAIFRVNDLEGRRNGFHAEVVNASFRLRKIDNSRLPAGWACQTLSTYCQPASHILLFRRQHVKKHKLIAIHCLLMGWSGRAPASPAIGCWEGRQR